MTVDGSYYYNGTFAPERPPKLDKTWQVTNKTRDEPDVEYAALYCAGQSLDSVGERLVGDKWSVLRKKVENHFKPYRCVGMDIAGRPIRDLIPPTLLGDFLNIKIEIINSVFENYDKPDNYNFLRKCSELIYDIGSRELNLDYNAMKAYTHQIKGKETLKKIRSCRKVVDYNLFGTKTGRLGVKRDSFPILTLNKDYRGIINPRNDLFLELDINACELRAVLALLNVPQPPEDLHEWHSKTLFNGLSRAEVKSKTFAWLYNPAARLNELEKVYNRTTLKNKYYDGTMVTTPYGRKIETDDYHALNYLVQSTASDIFLTQAVKVNEFLRDTKSFVSFTIHDSLIIDLDIEDVKLIGDIVSLFSDTEYGKYLVNVMAGKNFGDMRKIKKVA
mgnify:CR=1 FL=1